MKIYYTLNAHNIHVEIDFLYFHINLGIHIRFWVFCIIHLVSFICCMTRRATTVFWISSLEYEIREICVNFWKHVRKFFYLIIIWFFFFLEKAILENIFWKLICFSRISTWKFWNNERKQHPETFNKQPTSVTFSSSCTAKTFLCKSLPFQNIRLLTAWNHFNKKLERKQNENHQSK